MIEVLSAGYTAEYPTEFQAVEPERSRRECSLVHDVLDMFHTVGHSLSQLDDDDRASLGEDANFALTFRGFDFNDRQEGRLASYARYLIKTGRWESMAEYFDDAHERGNSHFPVLASYERMLSVWRPLWKKKVENYGGPSNYLFTVEELREMIAAWPYPKG